MGEWKHYRQGSPFSGIPCPGRFLIHEFCILRLPRYTRLHTAVGTGSELIPESYIFGDIFMQIISRQLPHAWWHTGTEDADINIPDTEQKEKKSTSYSHFKNEEIEAHEGWYQNQGYTSSKGWGHLIQSKGSKALWCEDLKNSWRIGLIFLLLNLLCSCVHFLVGSNWWGGI